jgi:hypothetical protein
LWCLLCLFVDLGLAHIDFTGENIAFGRVRNMLGFDETDDDREILDEFTSFHHKLWTGKRGPGFLQCRFLLGFLLFYVWAYVWGNGSFL